MPKVFLVTTKYEMQRKSGQLPTFDDTELLVIEAARTGPGVSLAELKKFLGIPTYQAAEAIKNLTRQGYLRTEDR